MKHVMKWISNFLYVIIFTIIIAAVIVVISTKSSGGEPQALRLSIENGFIRIDGAGV